MNRIMRQTITIIMIAVFLLGLCACSAPRETAEIISSDERAGETDTEPLTEPVETKDSGAGR